MVTHAPAKQENHGENNILVHEPSKKMLGELGETQSLTQKIELEHATWEHQVSLLAHGRWWGRETYAK